MAPVNLQSRSAAAMPSSADQAQPARLPATGREGCDRWPQPFQARFFLSLFVLAAILLGWILWPFWQFLVLSFLLAGIFRPAYHRIGRWTPSWLAALLTCTLITLIVFVPLTLVTSEFTAEAVSLYQLGRDRNLLIKLQQFLLNNTLLSEAQALLAGFGVKFEPPDVIALFSGLSRNIGAFIYTQASAWAANILQFALRFCLLLMVTFFLLIEFERLTGFLARLSPLPAGQNRLLAERFIRIAGVILVGNGLNGLVQGTLGGLLFALLEVKAPVLYGVAIGVLAFLPIFGAGLVLLPAALVFLLHGLFVQGAVVLVSYGLFMLAERFWIRPRYFRGQEQMHRLLILLAIIGGVSLFGLLGIIYGPLMVTAFLTLAGLYRQEYRQEPPVIAPPA